MEKLLFKMFLLAIKWLRCILRNTLEESKDILLKSAIMFNIRFPK